MVGFDGMDDFRAFAETASEIGSDHRMTALYLMIDRLAEIVKEPRAFCREGIKAKLGRHNSRQVGYLKGVVEDILPI